ncbi:MAG: protein kinase, partial [Planctomycetota bacterium]
MTTEQQDWALLQELFEKAVELSDDQVDPFLTEACGDNHSLREEVRGLVEVFQEGCDELEQSPFDRPANTTSLHERPSLDGYEIISEIHRGGQGTVLRAIQLSTKREVAVKLMHAGQFAGDMAKRRFEREVEFVGGLRHPGIVPVFDSGLVTDQYFYAMEYVDGDHLDDYVKKRSLDTRQILELFVEICDAVNHAQQRGVVHRDLKPSNILIDGNGRPRILDFGLAKSLSGEMQSLQTVSMTGQVMGTLAYMSPEQASGANDEIDTRTDVYALGVVLYELLTEELPYALDFSLAENLSAISHSQPNSVPLRRNRIGGEVSTILMKALQKEKDRRYGSAGAMGEDISRFLCGAPIEAKRDSSLYVIRKVLKRNYKTALASAAFLAVILASSVVSFGLFLAASKARDRADRNANLYQSQRDEATNLRDEGLAQLYVAEMNLAGQNLEKTGGIKRVKQLTDNWVDSKLEKDVRDWEWYFLQSKCDRESEILEHSHGIWCVDWHPERMEFVFGDEEGSVWTWRPGEEPNWFGRVGNQVRSVAWNCDGSMIAATCPSAQVVAWRVCDREEVVRVQNDINVITLDWHPSDPHRLAFADTQNLMFVWDALEDNEVAKWETATGIQSIHWTKDGDEIVAACHQRMAQIWNVKTKQVVDRFEGFEASVFGASLQPNGSLVAACDVRGRLSLFDRELDRHVWSIDTERMFSSVRWSPDGRHFASVGSDRVVRVFSDQGILKARFDGHENGIWGLDWSPDGSMLVTSGIDRTIRLWKANAEQRDRVIRTNPRDSMSPIQSVDWHPSGDRIAVFGGANTKYLLRPSDLSVLKKILPGPGRSASARWSPNGERIASCGLHKLVRILDAATGKVIFTFDRHSLGERSDKVHALSWKPDGDYLVSSCHRGDVYVWNGETGDVVAEHREPWFASSVDWHPTEPLIAIGCSNDHTVKLWHFEGDDPPETIARFQRPVRMVRWSPNGMQLAACSDDGEVHLWDMADRRTTHKLNDHTSSVECLAWNPSGTRLATGGNDLTIRIWDTQRGVQTLAFRAHDRTVTSIDWSPDGRQLVSGSLDSMVKIWDATKGYER